MNIRFRTTDIIWRVITLWILPKYEADVYGATDEEINDLKEWLKFQGIPYTFNNSQYYSADNFHEAEEYKPKITIKIRSEENLMALKLTWC